MELRKDGDPYVTRELLESMAAEYLDGADPADPRCSSVFADLRGLPPLLIQVGEDEILFDDAARIRDAATSAGVDTTFAPWIHGSFSPFDSFGRHSRLVAPRKSFDKIRSLPFEETDFMKHVAVNYQIFPNTIAVWQGESALTVYDATQGIFTCRNRWRCRSGWASSPPI